MYEIDDLDGLPVDGQHIDAAAEVFRILADPTRLRIIVALKNGERSVGDLAATVDRSAAAVSQHLAKLRWSRVVRLRHDGKHVFYRLADEHAIRLVAEAVMQAEHALDEQPGHHR